MKQQMKSFMLGVLITVMLTSTAFAGGLQKTIEVVFNKVNLTVNGQQVTADNILYNGTTYVPIRATADALGKVVGWDAATNTASINDKGSTPVPAPSTNDVASKIKAKAVADWPDNYQMQKFQIEQQTKAYNTIQALPNTQDYNAGILKKAVSDWIDDYMMQEFQYEQELNAYKELN